MIFKTKLEIIIDTREQTPFSFDPVYAEVSRGTLKTGDYALKNDTGFSIERKSLNDFVCTVTRDYERFCREIERMNVAKYPCKVIIVEADFKDFCFYSSEDEIINPMYISPKITPKFLWSRISDLIFRNINVIFAGDLGGAICFALLMKRNNQILGVGV